jgi:hypothetical protein
MVKGSVVRVHPRDISYIRIIMTCIEMLALRNVGRPVQLSVVFRYDVGKECEHSHQADELPLMVRAS